MARRPIVREVRMMTLEQWQPLPQGCCWAGCTKIYAGDDMPSGWSSLIVTDGDIKDAAFKTKRPPNGKPTVAFDLATLAYRHDTVLCPEHTAALDRLLKTPPIGGVDPLSETAGRA